MLFVAPARWTYFLGVLAACGPSAPSPTVEVPYRQDFAASLGPEWSASGGDWRVIDGRLFNRGAHNVPLWLSLALPRDVRIGFTALSKSDAVDIKCELFGDGVRHASGYVAILAGWKNSKSIIARLDEHGPERRSADEARLRAEVAQDPSAAAQRYAEAREIVARRQPMEAGRTYRLRLERQGAELRFYVDDQLHLSYFDPAPLAGRGHDRFAFNNWASEVYFDDLVIEPL